MASYLKEHSFGDIVRNTFQIYLSNFIPIFMTYFLLLYPFHIISALGIATNEPVIIIIGTIFSLPASLFAVAVVTLLVADVCLGNKPSLSRYFKRAFGAILWRLLGTNLLQSLIIVAGFILLLVPGILFTLWLMFASSIVILEQRKAIEALKRSKALGKGYYMRNFGIVIVVIIIGAVIGGILGFIFGLIAGQVSETAGFLFQSFIEVLATPIGMIPVILMYYDLRVRKEAYSNEILAEELHR